MDRAVASDMRLQLLAATLLLAVPLIACSDADDGPSPYDDEFPVSGDNVNDGAPDNDTLPDDNKADAVYPAKFEVGDQSPVKSQGSRGVCSIFAALGLVENLYIKAGMPVAEADFSEQHLQWSVKNQIGSFANTEGSSGDANLRAVVKYGAIKEADWVYETAPWTASNDAACTGGENLPTKCYTNGEPPQRASDAAKFKLPSSRWINTNSIKAHLSTKKTGVIVGFTFFYQSWNHRKSELPISTPLWQQGVVTYPNAKDKEVSLAKRAGHAIEIVGWDDEIAFDMRDEAGNPIKDAAGNNLQEKGFWIFKNSWGAASFGVNHPTGAGYGYLSMKYVDEFGSAVTAELPSLTPAREVCDDAGMADEDGDGAKNCDDTDCAASPACSSNNTAHTYTGTGGAIPDNSPTGISSTIEVSDAGTVTDVKVTVDITHTYRGDLTVSLVHGAVTKVLVEGSGGSADDLKQTFTVTGLTGAALQGGWTLKVEDTAGQDVGTLNSWVLETTSN